MESGPPGLGHERSETLHLARFSNYILDTEVGRPADAVRTSEIKKLNRLLLQIHGPKKTNVIDFDGGADEDARDGDDTEHGNQDARRSDL